jgi:hypothetical protein
MTNCLRSQPRLFHSPERVDIFIFDGHLPETSLFANQLHEMFTLAKWNSKRWHCTGDFRIFGASLSMALSKDQFVREGSIPPIQWAMVSLCGDLFQMKIECTSLATGFDPATIFSAWEMKEYASWDLADVAPLRVQVGAKQYIPLHNQFG